MAKGATLALLFVATILVFASAAMVALEEDKGESMPKPTSALFGQGSLYINDAGRSHGGFEYAAEYRVEVEQACNGSVNIGHIAGLVFALKVGLGDALGVHELQLRLTFSDDLDEMTLSNSSSEIVLVRVETDSVWSGEWDNYYIASCGGDAPDEEIRGEISPEVFGLPDHYYVELRLDVLSFGMLMLFLV